MEGDATLWCAYDFGGPDERVCRRALESCGAEFLDVRLDRLPPTQDVAEWIVSRSIRTLHVTGTREQYRPPYALPVIVSFLVDLFQRIGYDVAATQLGMPRLPGG